jgi:peptidoglycan/xylan/chitin deacetylase (PgdA/CDA1 family)
MKSATKTNVVLTVDTEPSIAGAFMDLAANPPLIHEPVAGEVAGRSEALGFLTATLQRHGLTATFFVETAHVAYFPAEIMGRYVRQLSDAGQDTQLHLHPSWLSFENGRLAETGKVTDHCSELERPRLAELIARGCDQIEAWTGRRPTGMRTGNFSTALSVFEAMGDAGLEYASNICLAMHRPPEEDLWAAGGSHRIAGIRELPVTCFVDSGPVGRGKLRPMQITALSAGEQIALLKQAHDEGRRNVVIVTHPFEYLKKKDFRYRGMRPNRMIQQRLEHLCGFLAGNSDSFAVVPLEEAARQSDDETGAPLKGHALRAAVRAAANVVNDRLL